MKKLEKEGHPLGVSTAGREVLLGTYLSLVAKMDNHVDKKISVWKVITEQFNEAVHKGELPEKDARGEGGLRNK